MAMISAGVGAAVVPGPLLSGWAVLDMFFLNTPNDFNLLLFVVGLPPTIALLTLLAITRFARTTGKDLPIWPLALLLAPALCASLTVGARWLEL